MSENIKFTTDALTRAVCPDGKKCILVSHPKTQGLKLRITSGGAKSYVYQRRLPPNNESPGRLVDITLGRFGDLKPEQARNKAQELNLLVGQGKDPSFARHGEMTYGELFQRYIDDYARHETARWEEQVANDRRYFSRWRNIPVVGIKRADVQAWFYDVAGQSRTRKYAANACLKQMHAVINFGKRKDLVNCENPCTGVKKFPVKPRERFIQPGDEFARFAQALAEEPSETWRDFFLDVASCGSQEIECPCYVVGRSRG